MTVAFPQSQTHLDELEAESIHIFREVLAGFQRHKGTSRERVHELPDLPIVTYCWGPSCNAATKGAQRLAALGRQVREMIGGLEYWIREGNPTEGRRPIRHGEGKPADWGLVI